MRKNGVVENVAIVFISTTADIIGIISGIFGIFSTITTATVIVKGITAPVTSTQIIIAVICIVLIILTILLICNRKKLARNLLYLLLNGTAPQKCYELSKKEVIYEFLDRTSMRHEKKFSVRVTHPSFSHISDKYKWTGPTPLTVKSSDPKHYSIQANGSKFGLNRYDIILKECKRYSVGDTVNMGSVIEDIKDPNQESSLHLSSGIYEKTDRLILKVLFPTSLSPKNIRGLEYIHYNDDEHYSTKEIITEYENNRPYLCWVIDKPFYGGKYMIEWEF